MHELGSQSALSTLICDQRQQQAVVWFGGEIRFGGGVGSVVCGSNAHLWQQILHEWSLQ